MIRQRMLHAKNYSTLQRGRGILDTLKAVQEEVGSRAPIETKHLASSRAASWSASIEDMNIARVEGDKMDIRSAMGRGATEELAVQDLLWQFLHPEKSDVFRRKPQRDAVRISVGLMSETPRALVRVVEPK